MFQTHRNLTVSTASRMRSRPINMRWGSFLGGNHWSEFGATGNPDATHPYTAFIGNVGGGPNVDKVPLSVRVASSLPNSVSVLEPVAGAGARGGDAKDHPLDCPWLCAR